MTTNICGRNYSGDGPAPASGKKAPVASLRSSGGIDRGVCGETRELLRADRRNMALFFLFFDFPTRVLWALLARPGSSGRRCALPRLRLCGLGSSDCTTSASSTRTRPAGGVRERAAGVQKGRHGALSGLGPGRPAGGEKPWDPGFRPSGRKSSRVWPQTPRSISPQERKEAAGAFFPEAGADRSPE